MKRFRIVLPFSFLLLGVIAVGPTATVRAADGPIVLATGSVAGATPRAVAQTELKFVAPPPSSRVRRASYPVVQAEPLQPAPATSGSRPADKDMPVVVSLPMPEEKYLDWKRIGEVTTDTSIKIPADLMNAEERQPKDWAQPYFAKFGELNGPDIESRNWMAFDYYWLPSGFSCGPLYFEEINVERYGYRVGCLQPAVSAAHFFATIPLLPYKMLVHPPHECVYSLGYYRPGNCAPLQHEQFHFEADAAAAEAGTIAGLILLFTH